MIGTFASIIQVSFQLLLLFIQLVALVEHIIQQDINSGVETPYKEL